MSKSDCPSHEHLQALIAAELPMESAVEAFAHLETCVDCRTTLDVHYQQNTSTRSSARKPPDEEPIENDPAFQRAVERIKGDSIHGDRLVEDLPQNDGGRPDLVGEQLGQYRIVAKLGEGGMGAVYKAVHIKLDKVVALKVLPAGRLNSTDRIARFEREMLSVGRFNHPHIVAAMDAREIDGTHFLVMEYLEGIDLSELVKQIGRLPIADASKVVQQAAVGLQHAHQHDLIHRDIKPSNLMLTSDGQIKILDLGLALFQNDESGDEQLTSTGQIMGTLDYMAPEQIDRSHSVDIRADLYSLGCTLYKLLIGESPFADLKSASTYHRMKAQIEEPAPSVLEHRTEIPGELAAIVERLLSKDPTERYDDPQQLAIALKPFTTDANLKALYQRVRRQEEDKSKLNSERSGTGASVLSLLDDPSVPHREHGSRQAAHASAPPIEHASARTPRRRSTPWYKVATAAGGFVILAIVVFRLVTNTGTVTITSYDPSLEVIIKRSEKVVDEFEVRQRQGSTSYYAGDYQIEIKGGEPDGITIKNRAFTLTRGGEKVVQILTQGTVSGTTPKRDSPNEDSSLVNERPITGDAPNAAAWNPGSEMSRFPGGLIPRPADIPGVKRWQAFTRQPRGGIYELAWSPDGKWLAATVSVEETVRVYAADTGRLAHIFPQDGVPTSIYRGGLVWNPDSKNLAACNFHGACRPRFWNVDGAAGLSFDQLSATQIKWHPQGKLIVASNPETDSTYLLSHDGSFQKRLPKTHPGGQAAPDWSPDGKWLATSNKTANKTQLWRPDGEPGPEITGYFVAWHPDSRKIATLQDERVLVCNLEGNIEKTLEGYFNVSWRPDGKGMILLKRMNQTSAEVEYQPTNGAPSKRLARTHFRAQVHWSNDRSTALVYGMSPHLAMGVVLLRVAGDDLVKIDLKQNLPDVSAVAISPDGNQIAFGRAVHGDEDYSARKEANGVMGTFPSGQASKKDFTRELPKAVDVAWHPADDRFASASRDGTIRVWQPDGAQIRSLQGHHDWVTNVAWQLDGKALASISSTGEVRVWDDAGESQVLREAQSQQQIFRRGMVTFNPANGRQLVQTGESGIRIGPWNGGAYEPQRLSGIPAEVNQFKWSPDGRQFVAVRQSYYSGDHAASHLYFGRADGTAIEKVDFPGPVAALAWSPDASRLVVFSRSTSAPTFVLANGRIGKPLVNQSIRWVTDAAWSPDGQVFAAAGWDEVALWNEDGSVGPSLEDEDKISRVRSLKFSHDGRHLIAGGDNGIAIWDMTTLQLKRLFVPLPEDQAAVFSPAGELLTSTPWAENELVYVVERTSGKFELLTPTDFRKLAAESFQRRAAQWVLQVGGKLGFHVGGKLQVIREPEALPDGNLQVKVVWLERGAQIDDESLSRLRDLQHLEALIVYADITGEGLRHLSELRRLYSLEFNSEFTTNQGIAELKNLRVLTHLNLWGTIVTDEAIKSFAMRKNLVYLNLFGISDAQVRHLKGMTQLKSLCIDSNKITIEGLKHACEMTALTELMLRNAQISDDALALLKNFERLRILDLSATPISDAGLKHLAELKFLTDLGLEFTDVTASGVAELKESLPGCTINYTSDGKPATLPARQ